LEVVYEPMFYEGSYGFRPGRSAHDALRVLHRMLWEREVRIPEALEQPFRNDLNARSEST
jgi:hypothetical protein